MNLLEKDNSLPDLENLEENEKRLLLSAAFVFLLFTLVVSHLFTRNLLWKMIGTESIVDLDELQKNREQVYNVLVEQDFKDKTNIENQIKALSDEDATGRGGLTEKEGFHSLSPFYQFLMGGGSPSEAREESQKKEKEKDEVYEVGIFKATPVPKVVNNLPALKPSPPSSGSEMRIPANYRFQQDFLFRWDGSRVLSIPRKQLAGYHYFKNMLRKIEGSFYAPGGGNYAYRDMAGLVIREGILPGEIKVAFLLNDAGEVLDVRVEGGNQGQKIVEQACVESIRGQNFGPVPPEVKENGLIFGINFIFPDVLRGR